MNGESRKQDVIEKLDVAQQRKLNDLELKRVLPLPEKQLAYTAGIKTHDSRGFQSATVVVPTESVECHVENQPTLKLGRQIKEQQERTKAIDVSSNKELNVPKSKLKKIQKFKNSRENSKSPSDPRSQHIKEIDQQTGKEFQEAVVFNSREAENCFLGNMKRNFYAVVEENKKLKEEVISLKNRNKTEVILGQQKVIAVQLEQQRIDLLASENTTLRDRIKALERELAQTRADNHEQNLRHKDETFLCTENEHLKAENDRLFCMLRSTAEYQTFSEFADHEHRLRYLKNLNFYRHLDQSTQTQMGGNVQVASPPNCHKQPGIEKLLWVPQESFKLLHRIAQNEKLALSEPLIDYILFELNKIWKRREEFIVSRCHVFCKNCGRNQPQGKYQTETLNALALASDDKDKAIARLKSELAQTNSRLVSATQIARESSKNIFKMPENQALSQQLKLAQRHSTEKRLLISRSAFLSQINQILRKQLDEHLLKNFYKLKGWQENCSLISKRAASSV